MLAQNIQRYTKHQLKKYNSQFILGYRFKSECDLRKLQTMYHELTIPPFFLALPNNLDFLMTRIYHLQPETVAWTTRKDFFFQLNVPHLDEQYYNKETRILKRRISTTTLKQRANGFCMIGFFLNSNMVQHLDDLVEKKDPFRSEMIKLPKCFKDVYSRSDDSESVLVSILDLTKKDLPTLYEAKELMIKSLTSQVFGVDFKTDKVEFYFHFPYDESTVGLHVHAKINEISPLLEMVRSYSFDDVVSAIVVDGSVHKLVMKRQMQSVTNCLYGYLKESSRNQMSGCASDVISRTIRELNADIEIFTQINPFRIFDPQYPLISNNVTQPFLLMDMDNTIIFKDNHEGNIEILNQIAYMHRRYNVTIGVVSGNTMENVQKALGNYKSHFDFIFASNTCERYYVNVEDICKEISIDHNDIMDRMSRTDQSVFKDYIKLPYRLICKLKTNIEKENIVILFQQLKILFKDEYQILYNEKGNDISIYPRNGEKCLWKFYQNEIHQKIRKIANIVMFIGDQTQNEFGNDFKISRDASTYRSWTSLGCKSTIDILKIDIERILKNELDFNHSLT